MQDKGLKLARHTTVFNFMKILIVFLTSAELYGTAVHKIKVWFAVRDKQTGHFEYIDHTINTIPWFSELSASSLKQKV